MQSANDRPSLNSNHPFWRPVLALFLIHATGDFYAMFCAPLLPELREQFGLTLEMATTLGTFYLIIQNYSQPVWGLISERFGRYTLLALGLILAAVGMSGLGLTRSFNTAMVALAIGGLGVGLFHPCAAGIAGHVTRKRAKAMTVFMVGGNVGVMFAPLIVPVLAKHDLRLVAWLCIPGILLAIALPLVLRRNLPLRPVIPKLQLADILPAARQLFWLHLRVVLRSVPLHATLLFLPLYCITRGYSKIDAGRVQGIVLLVSGVGVLLGGWLCEKLPRRPMMIFSEIGAGACLICATFLTGVPFVAVVAAALIFAYAVFPLQILMAQEAAPKLKGAAAGIVMGLAYGNSSLLLIPLNRMAARLSIKYNSEMLGMSRELQVAALGFFLAALIALTIKLGKKDHPHAQSKGT